MFFLYSVFATLTGVAAFPILLLLSLQNRELRAFLGERFGRVPPTRPGSPSPVWVHAVSVGEVVVARQFMLELARQLPQAQEFLLSSTTLAGRRVAAGGGHEKARTIWFPLDAPFAVRGCLRRLKPRALVLMETEIWPNLLLACGRAHIPVIIANGRISDRSYPRYRLLRRYLWRVLERVDLFCMQSERDADRIRTLGAPPERVRITGNIKWDAPPPTDSPPSVRSELGVPEDAPVLVAGSTSEGEEEVVVRAWQAVRASSPDLRLILAPRHPQRFEGVSALLSRAGIPHVRRSRGEPLGGAPVLLLDSVGELRRVYGAGTVCFVGGSLVARGGQNLLEPAVWGRPVLFGPRTENFPEVSRSLLEAEAGFLVEDEETLGVTLRGLLSDPASCHRAGRRALELIERNRGATRRSVEAIAPLLSGTRV